MKKKVEDILGNEIAINKPYDQLNDQEKLAIAIKQTLLESKKSTLTVAEREALWAAIIDQTSSVSKANKSNTAWWRSLAAGICILFISALILIFNVWHREIPLEQAAKINKTYLAKSKEVQLLNAAKQSFNLPTDTAFNYQDLRQKKGIMLGSELQGMHYSSIGVPYGKRSEIVLEDGTRVWLNAGSILTFPEKFDEDHRTVYLEGEGYFEVAPNANSPFSVVSEYLNIEVLGTSFNISTYSDDDYVSAILLTGSIAVQANGDADFERKVLKEGMEAKIDKKRKTLTVNRTLGDGSISWTKRRLLLNETHLNEIIKKLERFYNTKIEDASGLLSTETFSGSLDLTQTLPQVLGNIYDTSTYSIKQAERRLYIQRKQIN